MSAAAGGRPNIILIVSDDHGYADRSALGVHDDVRTPALDRLAAEGVSCSAAYVTAPICSPSRAGIITGRHQQRWGGLWFDSAEFCPDAEVPTLAELLSRQGYRTGYFGKVHYGSEDVGDRACPPHHGFDTTFYGLAGQSTGRLNYLHHSVAAQQRYGPQASRWMAVQPMLDGDEPVEHEGFLTAELGRRAREFVARDGAGGPDDDRPFFAMLAFNAVHNFCWQLPADELARRGLPEYADWTPDANQPYGEWYDDAIVPNLPHGREYYLAQLELMDAEIGRLLDQLEAAGQADNTLIVYTTDNGGSTCNFGDNTPLRGSKYTLWDGGIRVPMLWRWPDRLPAGTVVEDPVSTLDLMPSFATAVGATAPAGDGVDLLPRLSGADGDPAGRDRSLHWECGFQFAVRDTTWKLAWVEPGNATAAHLRSYEHAPVGDGWQLTRIADDIGETTDLLTEHRDEATRLLAAHDRWRTEIGLPPATDRVLPG